jgi:hypothetical protein
MVDGVWGDTEKPLHGTVAAIRDIESVVPILNRGMDPIPTNPAHDGHACLTSAAKHSFQKARAYAGIPLDVIVAVKVICLPLSLAWDWDLGQSRDLPLVRRGVDEKLKCKCTYECLHYDCPSWLAGEYIDFRIAVRIQNRLCCASST